MTITDSREQISQAIALSLYAKEPNVELTSDQVGDLVTQLSTQATSDNQTVTLDIAQSYDTIYIVCPTKRAQKLIRTGATNWTTHHQVY